MENIAKKNVLNLSYQDKILVIDWEDGFRCKFHYIWLRDNAIEARFGNEQRIFNTASIPLNIRARSASILAGGYIRVDWFDSEQSSTFSSHWLRTHCYQNFSADDWKSRFRLWGNIFKEAIPQFSYAAISTDKNALRMWLAMIKEYGFAVLHGVPLESGAVADVVDLFGYIRETNYGRYFDIQSIVDHGKLSFTNFNIPPSTSNAYRNPPPTLHLLHCLASSLDGGDTIVVDGFNVAYALRSRQPDMFKLLSTIPIRFRYRDEGNDLSHQAPVIRLDSRGDIEAIFFSNHSAAPFSMEFDLMEAYYDAYQTFDRMLNSPEFQFHIKLKPGDLAITNNLRVLIGRTAFADSGGSRHLQACFADFDSVHSQLNMLSRHGIITA